MSAILPYDPLCRLYRTTGTVTTRLGYDGDDLIAEYTDSNVLQRRYVHGPGSDESLVWYEGSGTSDRRWLHADERGSISAISNASGASIAINAYDEYGVPQSTNLGRFQYTGQQWLADLGLYYYKARVYSATLGRFLQTDPLSYAAGDMNLYAYVGNDPINKIDPRGFMETVIVTGSRWDPWFWWYTPFMYPTHVFTGGMGFAPGTVSGEAVGNPPTQGEKPLPQCTRSLDFDFNQFPDQIEENRLDLGATLATLFAAEAIGTMPKTPSELRGLGVPKSELNPYTSQASRWSHRIGRRPLQEFGRTGLGMAASTVATLGVVFEGFYDWGVIGKAAWDATSLRGCSP